MRFRDLLIITCQPYHSLAILVYDMLSYYINQVINITLKTGFGLNQLFFRLEVVNAIFRLQILDFRNCSQSIFQHSITILYTNGYFIASEEKR